MAAKFQNLIRQIRGVRTTVRNNENCNTTHNFDKDVNEYHIKKGEEAKEECNEGTTCRQSKCPPNRVEEVINRASGVLLTLATGILDSGAANHYINEKDRAQAGMPNNGVSTKLVRQANGLPIIKERWWPN